MDKNDTVYAYGKYTYQINKAICGIANTSRKETTFNELVHFLRRKNSINLMDAFSVESILEYDGLVIDLRYRTVKVKGKSIELTNYEYEILYLLANALDRYFRKNKSIHKYGIPLIMEQKIM